MMLWMLTHYIADAHMPFHCDNRALASTADQDTHCDVEKLWGEQVPELFKAKNDPGHKPNPDPGRRNAHRFKVRRPELR